jgi:hypothetical protein
MHAKRLGANDATQYPSKVHESDQEAWLLFKFCSVMPSFMYWLRTCPKKIIGIAPRREDGILPTAPQSESILLGIMKSMLCRQTRHSLFGADSW